MIREVILTKNKVEMMKKKMNRCFYDIMFVKRTSCGKVRYDLMRTLQMVNVKVCECFVLQMKLQEEDRQEFLLRCRQNLVDLALEQCSGYFIKQTHIHFILRVVTDFDRILN